MPYYVRILSPKAEPVELEVISAVVAHLGCSLSGDIGARGWQQLECTSASGEVLFLLERHEVHEGSIAEEEIEEFEAEIAHSLPRSAAEWLRQYLPSIRTIYAFQLLDATNSHNGRAAFDEVRTAAWNAVGGIFQADGEGFTNEDGYHILWQFSDHVDGEWWVAVLQGDVWETFKIDLGNEDHRSAFKAGKIPNGTQLAR